jgi:hypothetical protein
MASRERVDALPASQLKIACLKPAGRVFFHPLRVTELLTGTLGAAFLTVAVTGRALTNRSPTPASPASPATGYAASWPERECAAREAAESGGAVSAQP